MIRTFKYRLIFLLLGFFILNGIVVAQSDYKNEAELIKKADQLFGKEDFINAFRPYSQLLSVYPKNPLYNFRFGVCLMFADKRDKEKPIEYLEFARDNLQKEPDVYYFLAYAYHLNYRFSEAIKSYQKFIEVGKSADLTKFEVERKIEMCNNGISLLSNIRDLYVLEKKEVRKSDFFRAYKTNEFGGDFLSKPEEFKTKLDKKKEDNNFVFFSNQNQVVYYASYGKKGETGKDIYRVSKLPGGKWTEPQKLNEVINSPYDEDFPYMSPDGKTLFFCSKGHNTMGGYDVFVSTFNPASFMWSTPVNVNFPINTPFDDILFVSDSVKGFAYFASERISTEGQITVYKVGIDTRARESENLALAYRAEESGKQDDYLKAIKRIKEKANLDVNTTPESYSETIKVISKSKVDSTGAEITDIESENRKTNKEPENIVISNEEIIDDAFNQHKKVKEQIADLKIKRDVINKIGNERVNSAKEKRKEANESEYNANVLRTQAAQEDKEAELAFEIAKDITKQIKVKEIEAEKVLNMAADIQKMISANELDSTRAMYDRLVNMVAIGDTFPDLAETILNHQQKNINEKKAKSIQHYNKAKELEKSITELKQEVKQYRDEAEKIGDAELKAEYITKADEYEKEIDEKQKQVSSNYDSWKKNRNKADSLVEQTKSINNIIAEVNETQQETKEKTTEQEIQQTKTEQQTQTEVIAENQTKEKTTEQETQQTKTEQQTQTEVIAENQPKEKTTEQETQQTKTEQQTQTEVIAENQTKEETTEQETQQTKTGQQTQTEVVAENQPKEKITEQETEQNKTEQETQTEVIAENQPKEKTTEQETQQIKTEQQTQTEVIAENQQKELEAEKVLIEEVTKTQITSEANQYIIAVEEKINDLTNQSKAALVIANEKNKQAKEKQTQSNNLIENSKNVNNESEKEAIIISASKLEKEAQELAKETVAYFNISKQLDKEIAIRINEIEGEKQSVQQIEVLVEADNIEAAQQKLTEFNKSITEKTVLRPSSEILKTQKQQEVETKQNEFATAENNISTILTEKDSLTYVAEKIRNEANLTEDESKKSELIVNAENIEKTVNEKNEILKIANNNKNTLNAEITALQSELNITSQAFAELKKPKIVQNATEQGDVSDSELIALEEEIITYKAEKVFVEPVESREEEIASVESNEQTQQQELQTTEATSPISPETKTTVVNEATTYVDVYKEVAEEISIQAKKALVTASQKSKVSNDKLTEAEELTASLNNIPETQKESITIRIQGLKDESVVLAREAITAYKISKQLDSKAAEIQTKNLDANQKLEEIISLLDENKLDEANIKSNELKTGSENINSDATLRKLIEIQDIQIAENKQVEADNVFAIAENYDNEAFSLEVQAKKLREEAGTIRRISKRRNLILDAEQMESDALAKHQLAMEQRNRGSQLQIEATALKTQIEYTTQYITQSESATETEKTKIEPVLSNIDITQLEKQINTYESRNVYTDSYKPQTIEIAQQKEEVAQTDINQQNETEIQQTKQKTQTEVIAENQQQQVEQPVTEKQQITEIPDIDKAYTKSQYYTKSANLVNAEIQILESRSANISDVNLKNEYLSRISSLRNLGDSLQNLASEAKAEVNLLRITQNAALIYTDNQVDPDSYVKSLLSEAQTKNKEAQTLRQNAENAASRNERNEMVSSAENLESKANQAEIDAKEIEGVSNQNKYLSNKVKIEQQKIEDPNNYKVALAKSEEQEANYYYKKAEEYRNSASANIAVNSKKSLLDEAGSFERIALSKQQKALEIYLNENPNAVIDETFIAQNTISKETVQTPAVEVLAQNQTKSNEQTKTTETNNNVIEKVEQTKKTEQVKTEVIAENQADKNVTEQETQIAKIEKTKETEVTEIAAKRVTTIGVYVVDPGQAESRISAYNENNPIPHNVGLPTGLIYKVQIAAFRKIVSHDVFKGLAPITSEEAPNSNFIRYMAGIFTDYNPALSARDNIRQMGYRDAFVVAYFNGSRISIARARELIQSGEAFTSPQLANAINIKESAKSLVEAVGTTRQETEATPVETKAVGDLFYSVQVGVYSTPRTSQQLFGIGNLFNDRLNNGYYRYFSGKYNTRNEAVPIRDNIRLRGVNDAFIVSFYNNNKISLSEAGRIQAGGLPRRRTMELQTGEIHTTVIESPRTMEENQNAQQEQQTQKVQAESSQAISFRVQIGAYRNEISPLQLNLFKRITNVEIQSYKNESGLIIYTIGNFNKYADALDFKNNIVNSGMTGAFVIAFNGNKRIAVQQAIELQ